MATEKELAIQQGRKDTGDDMIIKKNQTQDAKKKPLQVLKIDNWKRPILYLVASVLTYLSILGIWDFERFYHNSRRAFLFDFDFINPFLRYVAGPMDCLASLVTQLYYYPWLGALAIFSILVLIYTSSRIILQSFSRTSRLVSLLPAAMGLFLLQLHITVFPLLSFAFSLCLTAAYVHFHTLPLPRRLGMFTVLAVTTCYVAGGTVLLLATICGLYELFVQKKSALAAGYLVLGALIPYVLGISLYDPDLLMQYFIAAPLEEASPTFQPLEITWYAFWPVAIIGTVYAKKLRSYIHINVLRICCILALTLICGFIVNSRFDRSNPMAYLHFYAENAEWENALEYALESSDQASIMTAHIVNYSLYHTGRLPHDMFDYPQFRNENVLLLEDTNQPGHANRRSDVYYYLGRIDQAERWAHHVLTNQGAHGPALRRLVSTNVLKNRPRTARVYAGVMQKTVTHRNLATELIGQFDKGELLATDDDINRIRPLLPKADYVGQWTTEDLLKQQLHEAPTNRMAFEYLMAQFLITGNIKEFGENVYQTAAFGHQELPRAYEEACMSYLAATGQRPPNLSLKVGDETFERFDSFLKLFRKHNGDPQEGWAALKNDFGNTYWFFDLFGRSGSLPPPNFDRKQ